MSEKNKSDLHTAIIMGLQSKEPKIVIDSIQQLRNEGKLEDIGILLDTVLANREDGVKDSIFRFLADIKDKKADKLIMDAISNEKYKEIRKELVGVCWESSLDFSPYVSKFVDLLIHSDFETSFEAFTVIENLTGTIPDEVKQLEQKKLKHAVANAPANKKGMLHEAIHIIGEI